MKWLTSDNKMLGYELMKAYPNISCFSTTRQQLLTYGVKPEHIEVSGICTYHNNDDFFSARRQGIRSGRILSGILLGV